LVAYNVENLRFFVVLRFANEHRDDCGIDFLVHSFSASSKSEADTFVVVNCLGT